ncbi:hypothetical protein Q648_00255 [Bartonella quintana JK 12]|uniref:Uncharacterized protein n=1 Tax=Bartonella quintana JK 68 TaxID=1134503 RepID=A0ABR4SPQ2_BARQI|nr:hypothetical protein Q651_00248 [Bartonella quintana BQ2-D70]ETS17738.1 hypothetical protein Q647_00666 [Bartonella quintana JK 7]ETS18567.1 hypothetical protein Q648_00255 [Bartonella quintana JK 12]KEC62643.1 hypothetical protein O7Y_00680 [Bartonella quintana JK 63]KEC63499.1 hypothetical protein O91_00234 [Bartonella quintana JK 31]KEC64065.1 hypothetical protein O7W_01203 [Bartonella quintana JK 56]KEC66052.1 hypothetical protein O7U_00583 [Bartonella quintana JK 68]KEC67351.1 hypoth
MLTFSHFLSNYAFTVSPKGIFCAFHGNFGKHAERVWRPFLFGMIGGKMEQLRKPFFLQILGYLFVV